MWGAQNSPSWNRHSPLPRELGWAQVLLWVQFALTVLYVVTVLSVVSYHSGEIFGILVYDSLPSVAGVYLARRLWRGGVWTSRALIAVQAWIVWLSLGTLLHGDLRGCTQAAMPVAVIVLLRRARSREWFEIPSQDREERRAFSLARMIRWRQDEGQTAVEYAGLIAVVAAIIVALSVGGLGGRIADGIQSAVCSVTGTACPAPQGDGTETGAAGDNNDGAQRDGSDTGAGTGGGNGEAPDGGQSADGGAGADGAGGANGETGAEGDSGTQAGSGGQQGTSADGATGGNNSDGGPAWSTRIITYDGAGTNDTVPLAPGPFDERSLWDDVHDQERHDRTFMDHVRGFFVAPTKSFLASTMDVVSDPVGSIKDSWNGLKGYTTNWWGDKADELGEEWDKGNYVSSVWGWINSPEDFVSDLATDTFVDKENWEKGNYGASIGNTVVGVVGIFSPKTITKFTKFEKLAEVGESLDKAADAAETARKAAKAGDAEGARKAAKDADEAAAAAEKQARESGCTIAAPARRIPYGGNPLGTTTGLLTGSSGTGTTILAAGPSDSRYVILAQDGCDEEAQQQAQDARKQADEADRTADEAELADRHEAAGKALDDEGVQHAPRKIDEFVQRAKDNPDPDKKEIGKEDAARALDDISKLARTKSISKEARSSLTSKVTNAKNTDELSQARAELNAVQRAADSEAAPGTTVHTAVGKDFGKENVDLGNGETVNISEINDADVLYRGKDGKVHAVEVKNTGNATIKADFERQVEDLANWEGKGSPGRATRVEIETTEKWTNIFSGYKSGRRDGVKYKPEGTPAGTMAKNGVPVRIAGTDISPSQLKRMEAEIQARKQAGTMDWSRMKDPKEAMDYLGVS
jgi:Flp pilus assembly pilin Flp